MIHWAFDTESGLYDGHLANRVITYAPVGIRHFSDVRLVYAEPNESVYDLFWNRLKNAETDDTYVFHVWNLDWEIKPIQLWFYNRYVNSGYPLSEFNEHYSAVLTDFGYYSHTFSLDGITVKFVDDNNHLHCPLKDAIGSIMATPKFRRIMDDNNLYGKESDKVDSLHEIWYKSDNEPIYLHYAKVDAFGTALVTESLFEAGRFSKYSCYGSNKLDSFSPSLSASGTGFMDAKCRILYGMSFEEYAQSMQNAISNAVDRDYNKRKKECKSDSAKSSLYSRLRAHYERKYLNDYPTAKWNKKFGLLTLEQQSMVEHNLRGGFVWGMKGHFRGTFYHYDYKSSYPYEYVYGKLPVTTDSLNYTLKKDGKNVKDKQGNPIKINRPLAMKECSFSEFNARCQMDDYITYLEVEFSFELKTNALPLLTLKECPEQHIGEVRSKKPRKGHTRALFLTFDEWVLINRLYTLSDIKLHKTFYSIAKVGLYTPAIKEYFDGKESTEGVLRALHKLDLNGATHGRGLLRRITSHDMRVELGKEIHKYKNPSELTLEELDTCPLQGFVAMSNARVRLLNQCMDLVDRGYNIYMCDTDSMITDCPPDTANGIWKQNNRPNTIIITDSKEMRDILGMLEIEPFSKKNPKLAFDELIVWGLKRYLEKDNNEYRKSAFAGMNKRLQKDILMKHDVNDTIEWSQNAKKWIDDCYALRPIHKIVEPDGVFV